MNEFWTAVKDWLNDKTNTPLYFTFVVFYIAWNWQFFQIIFLEDASLFRTPRVQYLLYLQADPTPYTWVNWVITTMGHVVPPAIFTFFAIVYLPKLHIWASKIYWDFYFERKVEYQSRKVIYEKRLAQLKEQEAGAIKQRVAHEEVIEQTSNKVWDTEVYDFSRNRHRIRAFKNAAEVIYGKKGEYVTNAGAIHGGVGLIEPVELASLDASNLIAFSQGNYGQKIDFTEKGKYFLRRFQERNIMK